MSLPPWLRRYPPSIQQVVMPTGITDVWRGWPGPTHRGRVVPLSITNRHIMVAGQTGSGKTNAAGVGMAVTIACCPSADLWQADPSYGPVCKQIAPLCSRVANELPDIIQLLEDALRLCDERAAWIDDRRGRPEVGPGDPITYLLIDESTDVWKDEHFGQRASYLVGRIARKGRKYGVILIHLVTRPAVDSMPISLRGQSDSVLALRLGSPAESDLALGGEFAARGITAVDLPDMVALMRTPAQRGRPLRVRIPLCTDVPPIVARCIEIRRAAGAPLGGDGAAAPVPPPNDPMWEMAETIEGEVVAPEEPAAAEPAADWWTKYEQSFAKTGAE